MATVNDKMTAIADAFRRKINRNIKLNLDDMAIAVDNVYDNGIEAGLEQGTEAGRKAEHSDFWDAFQCNGQRRNYYRAFCNANNVAESLGWNEVTFRPKHDIKATTIAQGFSNLNVNDLDSLLKECGVVLDTSACTTLQQAFNGSKITIFPVLHLKAVTNAEAVFSNCKNLHTVRKIIFESGINVSLSGIFAGCSALANIDEVEGSIEHNISFSSSPLTVETMKKIISCLKDYSGTDSEFTYKVTFSSACITALEAEGNTSPNGNTWIDYINDLKWNC